MYKKTNNKIMAIKEKETINKINKLKLKNKHKNSREIIAIKLDAQKRTTKIKMKILKRKIVKVCNTSSKDTIRQF